MSKVTIAVIAAVLTALAVAFFMLEAGTSAPVEREPAPPEASASIPVMQAVIQPPSLPATSPDVPAIAPPPTPHPPVPMPIRPEFDAVLKDNPRVHIAHTAMQRQSRDPVWAAAMEDSYRRAFAANRELSQYGTPTAECRSTYCEIQMVAHGAPPMAREQWGNLLGRGLMDKPPPLPGSFDGGIPTHFEFGAKVTGNSTALIFNVTFERPATSN